MPTNRLPVTLLTGFLGAGKTTVLNQLIRQRAPERIMVIENEVGQTNVDGALVEAGVEDVVELTAGCLCCSLSDGLLDALEMVSARRAECDRLVIETTGVADPASIVQVFLADRMVGRYFELEQVICVVDAGNIEEWLTETEEALRQLAMADVILLHKLDTVSDYYLKKVKAIVTNANPHAVVFAGNEGAFPYEQVMATNATAAASFEERLLAIDRGVSTDPATAPPTGGSAHKVSTFTLTFTAPFVLDDYFSIHLHRLVNLYRDQVYRIKGLLYVRGYPNRVILQSVRTACLVTDGSVWKEGEVKESKLVFIGRGLQREAFVKMLGKYTRG